MFALRRITELSRMQSLPCGRLFDFSKFSCLAKSHKHSQENSDDSEYDSDEAQYTLVKEILSTIRSSSPRQILLSQIGNIVQRRPSWRDLVDSSGGVKSFCLQNIDKLELVDNEGGVGGAYVREVSAHKQCLVTDLQRAAGGSDSGEPSSMDSDTSSNRNNFARFCQLLLELTPTIMSSLFKSCFTASEGGRDWSASCGLSLLDKMDDYNKRRLGKQALDKIVAGNCNDWDITLLSSLLLVKPGYMADNKLAKDGIESIRGARNDFLHSSQLAKQSMSGYEFETNWKKVSSALEALIDCLPYNEKEGYRAQITSIATEACQLSKVEAMTEAFRQEMREIAQGAFYKAEEALKATEKAATQSQVERIVNARLESLLNLRGQVGLSELPEGLRDVELNNGKKYRLLSELGRGGMGTVFRAVQHDDRDQQVAFKICETTSPERAEREVRILQKLAELRHNNIVRFLDSSMHSIHVVIIMELINGESLDRWLTKRYAPGEGEAKPVKWEESKTLMMQLASGMAAIHKFNVAHRDLKPSNLMIDEATGKLVIVDFGLSKQHNTNSTMTTGHAQLGTLLYMSPEQIESNVQEISCQADVWAMGVIWHEILTYYTPFEPAAEFCSGENSSAGYALRSRCLNKKQELAMVAKICEIGPRRLTLPEPLGLPESIIKIICKCLESEKSQRYEHAGSLLEHMKAVFQEIENSSKERAAEIQEIDEAWVVPDKPVKDWTVEEVYMLLRNVCG
jgi:serine/threonine protein kinase